MFEKRHCFYGRPYCCDIQQNESIYQIGIKSLHLSLPPHAFTRSLVTYKLRICQPLVLVSPRFLSDFWVLTGGSIASLPTESYGKRENRFSSNIFM